MDEKPPGHRQEWDFVIVVSVTIICFTLLAALCMWGLFFRG